MHSGVGAFPYADSTGTGYSFRVWAPNASSVQVVGDFNYWQYNTPLIRESGGEYWSCDVQGAQAGDEYKYYLNGNRWRKDPRSRLVTEENNCVLVDPGAYSWEDEGFVPPAKNELVIYEMHVGSFYDPVPGDIGVATFSDAMEKLDYLADLGINCVELMPVARFPGDRSWGYNPIDLFAVENSYGGPDQFKRFVDACHQRGIAVHLDVVHNHYDAANSACDLWEFDGWYGAGNYGGIYFYQEDGKCCTIWGRRPNYDRQGVRDFITDNVRMWLDEYHVDGFRWDSPMNIKYYDEYYYNPQGYSLLYGINQMVRDEYTNRFSSGEDQQLNVNFDSEWYDSFHYNVVGQLTPSDDTERDMWTIADQIAYNYGQYRVIYTESHDKVGKLNNDTRLVSKIDPANPTGYWARKRATLGMVLTMTSPGIPLLFMGQEWFEPQAFDDFDPLDWNNAENNLRSRLLNKHLIHLRRDLYGTSAGLKGGNGAILHVNDSAKVIAWSRYDEGGVGDDVVVAANFSVQTWGNYEIEFPRAGTWYAVFNSDWSLYSTEYANVGPTSVYVATAGGKAAISLAPYSAMIFSQSPPALFDVDQDSMLDTWESAHGLNPNDASDALLDPDSDLLSNRREFELSTDPHSYTALHDYDSMNLPGSANGWNLSSDGMKLTSHYTWEYVVQVVTQAPWSFKVAANQSWNTCWGDADQAGFTLPVSGTGDPGGDETPVEIQQTVTNATLHVTFCETNLHYTVEILPFQDHDGDLMNDAWESFFGLNTNDPSDADTDLDEDDFTNYEEYQNGTNPEVITPKLHDYNTMALVGTFNNWDVSHANMKLFENYGWEVVQPVWTQSVATFKFAGNASWDFTWGDNDQWNTTLPLDSFGDWQGADIRIASAMNGVYRYRFNQKTVAYSG
ncbi:MAG: alpha-amylase family glycosyl hydrolase, partial [Kiritimatiellae bacterium]|nr:alpha-amylase family glycosyl hydrolase [Kiritimatiellia bacterium]